MGVTLTMNGSTIAGIAISRPGWNAEAEKAVPTAKGQDRRHVEAWWLMREKLAASLSGKTLQDAMAYLAKRGIAIASSSQSQVEWGVEQLVKQLFNKTDNLWAGAAKPNRFLGAGMKKAEKLFDQRKTLVYPVMMDVTVPDDKGGSSAASIPLANESEVIDWLYNMSIDWKDYGHVKAGAVAFEEFMALRGV